MLIKVLFQSDFYERQFIADELWKLFTIRYYLQKKTVVKLTLYNFFFLQLLTYKTREVDLNELNLSLN